MPHRWILPLAGLLLASCAATRPEPVLPAATPEVASTVRLPAPARPETVDDHLYQPSAPAPSADGHVHDSVWERMVHSYRMPECSERAASREWAKWYAERPDYMARVVKRANPWIWFIVEELEFRGLPGELALIPIVESAYDPFAFSVDSALGTWQFMSATGRQYGLEQNAWYDGRRDVWASSHAAFDYFMYLRDFFEGDWLLALAAYNAGEGRVGRAVQKNLARGKPGDFWHLDLPGETDSYVPKLLGLACLFRDPEVYGWKLPVTPDQQVIATIDFQGQTDLVLAAQAAGVPIDQLFTLNPGFNRWATPPEGPSRLVLPLDGSQKLETLLQGDDPPGLMRWDLVEVRSGDSLSKLSAVHQVPVSVIREANDLQSNTIRPGQKLRLPRDSQNSFDPLYAQASLELQKLQSGLLAADRIDHLVRSGESLSVIAKRYRVSVKDLQTWNRISDPRKLRAGQKLVVYHSPAPRSSQPHPSSYTVRSGDSLWSISRKFKVSLENLMRWNGINSASTLHPGQSLKLIN